MVITKINEIYQTTREKMEHPNSRRNASKKTSNSEEAEDCFSCRLIGSIGVAAIGVYVAYQTKKAYDHNLIHNQRFMKSKVVAGITFTAVAFVLAYMRFNDVQLPWTRSGIDESK